MLWPGKQGGSRVTIDLYGIPNCDTVKTARAWLDTHERPYIFHDFKKEGANRDRLAAWADKVGWALLLNTRGTTFRQLPDNDRAGLAKDRALALMEEHPSLIKRPVLEYDSAAGGGLLVGFDSDRWSKAIGAGPWA